MNIPWLPVVLVDMAGSALTLLIALLCAHEAWRWYSRKNTDVFRHYLLLLTFAFVLFAISRSFGHLVKQLLQMSGYDQVWAKISPFSGAINTATFILVASFSIYFKRVQVIHREIENYKTGLEELVMERTRMFEESNAMLETVLNSANPICITNLDYEIIKANRAYYEIWPQKSGGGAREKCFIARPGSGCGTDDCPIRQIGFLGRKEVVKLASKELPGDGRGDFIVTARPLKDVKGELMGVVGSYQDISEQVKAADELMKEREQLRVTLRSIRDGVITTDPSGNITLINQAAELICGWTQEEAQGLPFDEVFNLTDRARDSRVGNLMEETQTLGFRDLAGPKILVARDGREKLISESSAPLRDRESRVIGSVLVFRDVTEKVRIESELGKIHKLESIGVLAGGIAHDFNNILTAILGNINLALAKIGPENEITELLSSAEKASSRARNLTQQLLTFAKGGEPVKRIATIPEIITDSAQFVLRGSKVRCDYQFDDDLRAVEIDPGQISQVIQNIILNGAYAMPEGGVITVTCANLDHEHDGFILGKRQYVKVAITDQGSGIPADKLNRIFDPFFTTKKEGSGLGLAVSHSIIKNHGGHIEVDSEVGRGTTFTLYLPASGGVVGKEKHQVQASEPMPTGGRVMVMDDDDMIRELVGKMLESLGYEAVLAEDGQAAIRLYQAARERGEPVSALIMDLTIPGGMGGREAVREILAIDPAARVLVSSGYSNDPIMAGFREYGFSAAIVKPFKLQELREVLSRVLA